MNEIKENDLNVSYVADLDDNEDLVNLPLTDDQRSAILENYKLALDDIANQCVKHCYKNSDWDDGESLYFKIYIDKVLVAEFTGSYHETLIFQHRWLVEL